MRFPLRLPRLAKEISESRGSCPHGRKSTSPTRRWRPRMAGGNTWCPSDSQPNAATLRPRFDTTVRTVGGGPANTRTPPPLAEISRATPSLATYNPGLAATGLATSTTTRHDRNRIPRVASLRRAMSMKLILYLLAMVCVGLLGCVAIYVRFAVVLACIGGTFLHDSFATLRRTLAGPFTDRDDLFSGSGNEDPSQGANGVAPKRRQSPA